MATNEGRQETQRISTEDKFDQVYRSIQSLKAVPLIEHNIGTMYNIMITMKELYGDYLAMARRAGAAEAERDMMAARLREIEDERCEAIDKAYPAPDDSICDEDPNNHQEEE